MSKPAKLTKREQEVFALLSEGLTNQQMAERLFVSTRTIDFHLAHIYKKLGVTNRIQAVIKGTSSKTPLSELLQKPLPHFGGERTTLDGLKTVVRVYCETAHPSFEAHMTQFVCELEALAEAERKGGRT